MGFTGVIATDGLDMNAVGGLSVEEIVRRAYKAGNHLLLLTSDSYHVADSVDYAVRAADFIEQSTARAAQGDPQQVSAKEIENAAQKVLNLKKKMGIFGKGGVLAFNGDTGFEAASRRAAEEGVTLVRDSQNLLPLTDAQQNICTVFFAAPIFRYQLTQLNNTLTQNGKHVQNIFLPLAITEAEQTAYAQQIQACVQRNQVVVLGTSGNARKETIAAQYNLVQQALAQADAAHKPVVLLSLINPYEIVLYPQAQTVLALYGPTVDTAEVAAEILLGRRAAKGKLPVVLPEP